MSKKPKKFYARGQHSVEFYFQKKKAGMTWALPGMEELKERQEFGNQVGLHGLSVSVCEIKH